MNQEVIINPFREAMAYMPPKGDPETSAFICVCLNKAAECSTSTDNLGMYFAAGDYISKALNTDLNAEATNFNPSVNLWLKVNHIPYPDIPATDRNRAMAYRWALLERLAEAVDNKTLRYVQDDDGCRYVRGPTFNPFRAAIDHLKVYSLAMKEYSTGPEWEAAYHNRHPQQVKPFMCYALDAAFTLASPEDQIALVNAKSWIHRYLGPHVYLDTWLQDKYGRQFTMNEANLFRHQFLRRAAGWYDYFMIDINKGF